MVRVVLRWALRACRACSACESVLRGAVEILSDGWWRVDVWFCGGCDGVGVVRVAALRTSCVRSIPEDTALLHPTTRGSENVLLVIIFYITLWTSWSHPKSRERQFKFEFFNQIFKHSFLRTSSRENGQQYLHSMINPFSLCSTLYLNIIFIKNATF